MTPYRYAKKNIDIPARTAIDCVYDTTLEVIDKDTVSHPIIEKEKKVVEETPSEDENMEEKPVEAPKEEKEEVHTYEQISIFDDED